MLFCRSYWRRLLFPDFVRQSCCNPCCEAASGDVLGVSTNVITTTCRRCEQEAAAACGCACCCPCCCGCANRCC